jgi:hypothetical protein
METVAVDKDVDKVLRAVARNRESVLVLKDGKPHCMIHPTNRIEEEMFRSLYRRQSRKNRAA